MRILHITSHMGGGVGHAISDLVVADDKNVHQIITLLKPEKKQYVEKCIEKGIAVYKELSIENIRKIMMSQDIIIIHWWHHPVMCNFLFEFPQISARIILWSHVSGCTYPKLSYQFIENFHRVFVTSEYSMENDEWSEEEKRLVKDKSCVIYGLGQLNLMQQKVDYSLEKGRIKIGYAGTFTKSKIHPEFPDICKKILERLPQAEFYLLGDKESGKWISEQAKCLDIAEKLHFEGFVSNVNDWLKKFDIFAYPLNPYHFGTTENAILEAMAAGVPVILLEQCTEKYIVTNGVDGILASDINHFIDAVNKLAEDESLRKRLGMQASKNIYIKFSFDDNLKRFQEEIAKVGSIVPKKIDFRDVLGNSPYEWFLCGVGKREKEEIKHKNVINLPFIFLEESKSSIIHFARNYMEDGKLQELLKAIEK